MKIIQNTIKIEEKSSSVQTKFRVGPKKVGSLGFPETLSLCPFVASFKITSLKYDFKHILDDFIHVYSPREGTDNPLGTKF